MLKKIGISNIKDPAHSTQYPAPSTQHQIPVEYEKRQDEPKPN